MPSYKYKEGKSSLLGIIKRPFISLEIYSESQLRWIEIKNVLADTGADICLLPRFIGKLLVGDITTGLYKKIRGVVPNTFLNGFVHNFKIKIGSREFIAPVLIADSEDVTPIFGRARAMDLFKVRFDGDSTIIEEK